MVHIGGSSPSNRSVVFSIPFFRQLHHGNQLSKRHYARWSLAVGRETPNAKAGTDPNCVIMKFLRVIPCPCSAHVCFLDGEWRQDGKQNREAREETRNGQWWHNVTFWRHSRVLKRREESLFNASHILDANNGDREELVCSSFHYYAGDIVRIF